MATENGDNVASLINDYEEALTVHIFDVDSGLDEDQKRELEEGRRDVFEARRQHARNKLVLARHSIADDRLAFIVEHEEELVDAMAFRGGSFAVQIANAWRRADSGHLVKLRETFGDLLYSYKKFLPKEAK